MKAERIAQIMEAARMGFGIDVHPGEFNELALLLREALAHIATLAAKEDGIESRKFLDKVGA